MNGIDETAVTLIGHPFAPIGMGELLRCHLRALQAVRARAGVLDIFRYSSRLDPAYRALIEPVELKRPPDGGIRVFHVNGDEVERVVAAFEAAGGRFAPGDGSARNVIVPAWELEKYPPAWAAQLARFDEIWAMSRFVQESLAGSGLSSHRIGLSVEPPRGPVPPLLPRRWFGIRESAFVLLHFLDLTSHAARKNPEAARELLDRLAAARPTADLQLVLKVKNGEEAATEWAAGLERQGLERPGLKRHGRVLVLSDPLDSHAVRSLVRCADCFVSLHRAEGFGRGLGEAMAEGRLALGTGWSGNLDFMTEANSLLVRHAMARVRKGDYPHAAGQRWATPDVAHAAELLTPVLDDPTRGRERAERGRLDVLRTHGNRAVGLRMLDRLEALAAELAAAASGRSPRRTARRLATAR